MNKKEETRFVAQTHKQKPPKEARKTPLPKSGQYNVKDLEESKKIYSAGGKY
jgi:hypothetical protein|tara:strand:- start:229 stop:384 length:156 start_codon:yes stop_codon:yes gene_type:complete